MSRLKVFQGSRIEKMQEIYKIWPANYVMESSVTTLIRFGMTSFKDIE